MIRETEEKVQSSLEIAQSPSITPDVLVREPIHPDQLMDGPVLATNADGDFSNLENIDLVNDPKSIAIETLYTLQLFLDNLIGLCARIMEEKRAGETAKLEASYERLLEGISTVMESILTARGVLRIGLHAKVNLLEADLLSILKDLLEASEQGNIEYRDELISTHLPQNLKEWREEGIPEMIRCRDS
jgi:hypothetical protein